jgi:hypothetical protein
MEVLGNEKLRTGILLPPPPLPVGADVSIRPAATTTRIARPA